MYISTKPETKGKANVLKRGAQLTDFKWTPVRDMPSYRKPGGIEFFERGKEYQGLPYSSVEPNDKFVPVNVSIETFMSALKNPDSALYTKDIGGHQKSWTFYGIVCNAFVRHCLDIPQRYLTKIWHEIPGMHKIAEPGAYTVDKIKLCDVLLAYGKGRNHVAIITDILRDEKGEIKQIEVSEAISPTCIRKCYDTEEFYEKYKLFGLSRYDYVDDVPPANEEDNEILFGKNMSLPNIAVDYGNKSNYMEGEETVISVFSDEKNEIEVYKNGKVIDYIAFTGVAKFKRCFEKGYYVLKLLNKGEQTEFCVTKPEISFLVKNDEITIFASLDDLNSELFYMDFRGEAPKNQDKNTIYYDVRSAGLVSVELFSEEEIKSGIITRKIPENAKTFKIYFKNKYGVWTHTIIRF